MGAGSGSGSDEERDAYIVCARCYVACITHALGHLSTCQEGSVEEQEVCVSGCYEMCVCVGVCGWVSVVVGMCMVVAVDAGGCVGVGANVVLVWV